MSDLTELRQLLRDFVEKNGAPVEFKCTEFYGQSVSTLGWTHHDAAEHIRTQHCRWVIAGEANVSERTYSQFTDTFHDNENEVGINVSPVDCACGEYTGMSLRYVGSLGSVLKDILSSDRGISI